MRLLLFTAIAPTSVGAILSLSMTGGEIVNHGPWMIQNVEYELRRERPDVLIALKEPVTMESLCREYPWPPRQHGRSGWCVIACGTTALGRGARCHSAPTRMLCSVLTTCVACTTLQAFNEITTRLGVLGRYCHRYPLREDRHAGPPRDARDRWPGGKA